MVVGMWHGQRTPDGRRTLFSVRGESKGHFFRLLLMSSRCVVVASDVTWTEEARRNEELRWCCVYAAAVR